MRTLHPCMHMLTLMSINICMSTGTDPGDLIPDASSNSYNMLITTLSHLLCVAGLYKSQGRCLHGFPLNSYSTLKQRCRPTDMPVLKNCLASLPNLRYIYALSSETRPSLQLG